MIEVFYNFNQFEIPFHTYEIINLVGTYVNMILTIYGLVICSV